MAYLTAGINDSIENMETIHARYLVGCDGAHSWTRSQLGVASDRNSEDSVWGVLDIVPITNFRMSDPILFFFFY